LIDSKPHIVVLGGGFGGLTFCQNFKHHDAKVTLIDHQNHHLFQPLLYQVATSGLAAPDIAEPIRAILSRRRDITILLDHVREIDLKERRIVCAKKRICFDYLVLSLGSVTSYFGHDEWKEFAPGLKSLDDAIRIRHDTLLAFEQAENESDAQIRDKLMTIMVIGGGPTGVELAGAFAELARHALRKDFRRIKPEQAKVVLVDAAPRLLPNMPPKLSKLAQGQLERLGVEIRLETKVKTIRQGEVEFDDGSICSAQNIIWAAGVKANPLTASIDCEKDPAGRLKVCNDLSLPGCPRVFAIGDMATVKSKDGKVVPGVSPAAMQMARHVAKIIRNELRFPAQTKLERPHFQYYNKGSMATVGRSAAVAHIGPLKFGGFLAWLAWLFVHLLFLIGFENRLVVLIQWAHAYVTYKRGARIVTKSYYVK
jgi:NADH:ubiquinone reductase (H+-translocating)